MLQSQSLQSFWSQSREPGVINYCSTKSFVTSFAVQVEHTLWSAETRNSSSGLYRSFNLRSGKRFFSRIAFPSDFNTLYFFAVFMCFAWLNASVYYHQKENNSNRTQFGSCVLYVNTFVNSYKKSDTWTRKVNVKDLFSELAFVCRSLAVIFLKS